MQRTHTERTYRTPTPQGKLSRAKQGPVSSRFACLTTSAPYPRHHFHMLSTLYPHPPHLIHVRFCFSKILLLTGSVKLAQNSEVQNAGRPIGMDQELWCTNRIRLRRGSRVDEYAGKGSVVVAYWQIRRNTLKYATLRLRLCGKVALPSEDSPTPGISGIAAQKC